MKQFFHILVLAILAVLALSCNKDDDDGCDSIKTNSSDYKDYVPYTKGEQLIFETVLGEVDTLVIDNYKLSYWQPGDSGCSLQENIHCDISIKTRDTSDLREDLAINFYDNTIFYNSLIIGVQDGNFQSATFFGGSFFGHINALAEIELNGHTYSDVLLAACPNPPDCTYIDSICFVKNEGLVYYTINGVGRYLQ
jgi:hypothetical protein